MDRAQLHKVLDHLADLHETMRESLMPSTAQTHFRAMKKEALLGVSELLYHAISQLDDRDEKDVAQPNHAKKRERQS